MKKTLITHNGTFHSDDVFSAAALTLLFKKRGEDINIVRTRDPEVIKKGDVVFDVGGEYDTAKNRFDHHQVGGAGARDDGIPFAAFGLVWKQYGTEVAGSKEAALEIDIKLVAPIDCTDNGFKSPQPLHHDVYSYSIENVIFAFHPTWEEVAEGYEDKTFCSLVSLAVSILEREIIKVTHKQEALVHLERCYTEDGDKRLLILDREYPWKDFAGIHPDILFVIYPDGVRGVWGVSAVRKTKHEFVNRKDLPRAWGGLRDEALASASGVPDAVFCHNKLFFAVAKSREGALALANIALSS